MSTNWQMMTPDSIYLSCKLEGFNKGDLFRSRVFELVDDKRRTDEILAKVYYEELLKRITDLVNGDASEKNEKEEALMQVFLVWKNMEPEKAAFFVKLFDYLAG